MSKRIKGSHHALRHPTVPDTVVVPVHRNHPVARARSATPSERPAGRAISFAICSDSGELTLDFDRHAAEPVKRMRYRFAKQQRLGRSGLSPSPDGRDERRD